MPSTAQFASILYALGAFFTWGISDFVGGYAARRFNSFYLAALGHLSGTALMAGLALANPAFRTSSTESVSSATS